MQWIKYLNMALAFLVELGMFASIAYWGFAQGKSSWTKWGIAIGCTMAAITLWGILAAPNSQTRLGFPNRLVFELFMFLLGSFLLYSMNYKALSITLALLSVVSVGIAFWFKQ
ncbi:MAG: YrdB family protein [Cytophagales bacterium]|nr:YrdB family protein [Cytophagales bacterium]